MTREERLRSDPAYREEYLRKARERNRRHLADPTVYAEVLRKNRERASRRRATKPPLGPEKSCTRCGVAKPATTEHFSPRQAGRRRLHSWCKPCLAEFSRTRRQQDPGLRSRHIAAVTLSKKKRIAADPEFRERHRVAANERRQRYRADPVKRERELTAARSRPRTRNRKPELGRYYAMKRYAAKLRSTPAWADQAKIKAIYAEAHRLTVETGIPHHVDHIIPLQGRTVCGLHVQANLRVITAEQNKRKFNRLVDALELIAA